MRSEVGNSILRIHIPLRWIERGDSGFNGGFADESKFDSSSSANNPVCTRVGSDDADDIDDNVIFQKRDGIVSIIERNRMGDVANGNDRRIGRRVIDDINVACCQDARQNRRLSRGIWSEKKGARLPVRPLIRLLVILIPSCASRDTLKYLAGKQSIAPDPKL